MIAGSHGGRRAGLDDKCPPCGLEACPLFDRIAIFGAAAFVSYELSEMLLMFGLVGWAALGAWSGVFAGLAGVAQFARLTVGDPTTATGKELDVIAHLTGSPG